MVMGVPESGVPAAEGFARASGIPYGQGLVKNRYIGRTFIAPGPGGAGRRGAAQAQPAARRTSPASASSSSTTPSCAARPSARSCRMLREAGAAEVHLRISSPPWRWPCFYGIDTPSPRRAAGGQPHGRRDRASILGADSLAYITHRRTCKAAIGAPTAGSATPASPATTRRRCPVDARRTVCRPARAGRRSTRPPGRAARGLTDGGPSGGATYAGAGVDIAAGDAGRRARLRAPWCSGHRRLRRPVPARHRPLRRPGARRLDRRRGHQAGGRPRRRPLRHRRHRPRRHVRRRPRLRRAPSRSSCSTTSPPARSTPTRWPPSWRACTRAAARPAAR